MTTITLGEPTARDLVALTKERDELAQLMRQGASSPAVLDRFNSVTNQLAGIALHLGDLAAAALKEERAA